MVYRSMYPSISYQSRRFGFNVAIDNILRYVHWDPLKQSADNSPDSCIRLSIAFCICPASATQICIHGNCIGNVILINPHQLLWRLRHTIYFLYFNNVIANIYQSKEQLDKFTKAGMAICISIFNGTTSL